jgi:hypothetical protein
MKRSLFLAFSFGFYLSIANAALWDRGGGLIYDDELQITWLQDANYAKTAGYDGDGLMSWGEATTWAANPSYFDVVNGAVILLPGSGSAFGPLGISLLLFTAWLQRHRTKQRSSNRAGQNTRGVL